MSDTDTTTDQAPETADSNRSENRIDRAFDELRKSGKRGLMPFICGGHPAKGDVARLIPAIAEAGATMIEVGLPFSDPIADGPVIAAAMHNALVSGSTVGSVIDEVTEARKHTEIPIAAMVSMSIVWANDGIEAFCKRIREAGFDGLIVPDAPLEESEELSRVTAKHGLTLSLLIAPTTPPERAAAIAKVCTGFVYLVARTGITGEREEAPQIQQYVEHIRKVSDLPIGSGFGIAKPEHVAAVTEHADAAIVGTALVRRIDAALAEGGDAVEAAVALVHELQGGLPNS